MIKYIEFKKSKLCFSDIGKGRAIVILPGFLQSIHIWDDFAKRLAKRFRVITIDLPGHGESESIGYNHSMELMAMAVKAVMNTLGLRRYILVGHSMGGYVSLAFAELFPKNLSAICLFHSTAYADTDEKKKERAKAIELVKKEPKQYINELINKLFAAEKIPDFKAEITHIKDVASKTSKVSIVNALQGMKERKSRDVLLSKAVYPILFIAGKKDTVIPFEKLMPQVKLCKYASALILEEAGHMGFIEEREKTLAAIKKFALQSFRGKLKQNLI